MGWLLFFEWFGGVLVAGVVCFFLFVCGCVSSVVRFQMCGWFIGVLCGCAFVTCFWCFFRVVEYFV